MSKKKTNKGICRLCKLNTELSFEHIPPKVAYNKTTRYYSIPHEEYYKIKNILDYKHKGIINQGGMGSYCLCKKCNSFLGSNYVRSYLNWVNIGVGVNYRYDHIDYIEITTRELNPLRILKQIISMFICINDPFFSYLYPGLLEFIKNPLQTNLSDRYKIYAYLNNEGQPRKFPWSVTNLEGIICEIAFPPFGYVLNIDNPNPIQNLTNISCFKNFTDERIHSFDIGLFKYPTYFACPLDYRSKEELEKLMNKDIEEV